MGFYRGGIGQHFLHNSSKNWSHFFRKLVIRTCKSNFFFIANTLFFLPITLFDFYTYRIHREDVASRTGLTEARVQVYLIIYYCRYQL